MHRGTAMASKVLRGDNRAIFTAASAAAKAAEWLQNNNS